MEELLPRGGTEISADDRLLIAASMKHRVRADGESNGAEFVERTRRADATAKVNPEQLRGIAPTLQANGL
ncbi:MAG: hypothetical protein L0387_02250 [Acidobacteria bacterium]|nr:hypothetical protein [Acidobacteriota bacterium]